MRRASPSCIPTNHHKCLTGKASIAERLPLAPTSLLSAISSIICPLYLLGRPAAMNPQVIPIQSDRLVFLVLRRLLPWMDSKRPPYLSCSPTGCCHGKIQSDLPNPSLLKRAIEPHQKGLLWPSHEVHWIPCWLGSYFSSSSLMTFIPPSILGSSRLVGLLAVLLLRHLLVLLQLLSGLGLTTSWRRTTEKKLSGL